MEKLKVAILGSTSHIAKGLIDNFLNESNYILHLYSRSAEKVKAFINQYPKDSQKSCIIHRGYDDFMKTGYEVIINCVGVGTMNKPENKNSDYFTVNEEHDNLAINYLQNKNPSALYISFSSGAVYGKEFVQPANEKTVNAISVNHVGPEDYYSIVRLYIEAKHRSMPELNIVDLRVFSYFSRFIDLTDSYFITELLNSILNKKTFQTSSDSFVRDYLHPEDLYAAIRKCIEIRKINGAFDINSSKPVQKKEMLDYFAKEYELKYEIAKNLKKTSPTGAKNMYYSKNNNAEKIGYKPRFSSMDAIEEGAKPILLRKIKG